MARTLPAGSVNLNSVRYKRKLSVVKLFGHEAVVMACGRTDAGVAVLIAAVTTQRLRSADEVRDGLTLTSQGRFDCPPACTARL